MIKILNNLIIKHLKVIYKCINPNEFIIVKLGIKIFNYKIMVLIKE